MTEVSVIRKVDEVPVSAAHEAVDEATFRSAAVRDMLAYRVSMARGRPYAKDGK